ncbi:MAG: UDP-N-acetylmuramate dehydrogenase [Cyclobacteriaceae bacterium]|nr:UDP-N-acetylmuramate dehydrogenase [Cyclobacteriaceae bacterium]
MISIRDNISLKHLNTFGIEARAKKFVEVTTREQLQEVIAHPVYKEQRHLILGGGSNILFTKDFDGLVIKSSITGIKAEEQDDDHVLVHAASGENWHSLVMHCIKHNYGGIENLSLIPGTVGASPIQNIGAYGVEIKDVIESVEAIDLLTGQPKVFSNSDCRFNYRESVFKQELKEKYFISSITLRLSRKNHQLNIQYGAIKDVLQQQHIDQPTIEDVSNAVIEIRRSKLPDPLIIGNAGSFFKNPTIDVSQFETLKAQYPSIPSYPADNQKVKIPAGWLIEQCGWKGKRFGNMGVHPQQALVLVNYDDAKGEEIFQLAMKIQSSVKEKFDITIHTEVNII